MCEKVETDKVNKGTGRQKGVHLKTIRGWHR